MDSVSRISYWSCKSPPYSGNQNKKLDCRIAARKPYNDSYISSLLHIKFGMGSAVSWSMVQEIIPQWLYWKLELMQVIVMGFNPQLTHLFEELQPLRKQGWHLWGLNTQSGDAKWCEMSEWTGTPRSFISFSYETSMSRRHCFVRAHAVWLSSHSMTLGAGGLQPPSPICVHGNTSPWY